MFMPFKPLMPSQGPFPLHSMVHLFHGQLSSTCGPCKENDPKEEGVGPWGAQAPLACPIPAGACCSCCGEESQLL